MKVIRVGFVFVFALALAGVASTGARSSRFPFLEQQVTFAQLTDAHLFDEGWHQPIAEAYRQAANNWKAFHWSIDRINALVQSGKSIDFVVYTGDLGLQNVLFHNSESCLTKAVHPEPGLPPTPDVSAANDLMAELDRLAVRTIFFVSGNNDLLDEDAGDGRFDCFLLALQERAQSSDRPLRLQKLGPDHSFEFRGFHLLGLNSASFKKASNYRDVCVPRVQIGLIQQLLDGACPQSELGVLRQQVNSRAPSLLFTHVPDLKDPFRREPSWDLGLGERRLWEQEATSENVLGIFAGHFHDSNRSLYGATAGVSSLALGGVASKTYLAPPLAIKNQVGKPQTARGFLLANVTSKSVANVEVQWFNSKQ